MFSDRIYLKLSSLSYSDYSSDQIKVSLFTKLTVKITTCNKEIDVGSLKMY